MNARLTKVALFAGAFSVIAASGVAAHRTWETAAPTLPPIEDAVTNLAEHKTFTAHGFELTAYPGFASRVRVLHGAGTEQVIYEQAAPFMVPPGQADADTRHVLRLRGGEHNRDVGLVIDDPHHQVARITIELYDQSNTSETKHAVETVIIDNDPVRCPPNC